MLWTGRPAPGLALHASDAFAIPFSLVWCGFAIFWETNVVRIGAPIFFALFGGAFVVIGLYFVFGRFIGDAWLRGQKLYALTDRRILIVSGALRRQVRSLFLEGLAEINLSVRRDGKGTITFGRDSLPWWMQRGFYFTQMGNAAAFELIEAPQRVLALIRGAQRSLSGRP
jgi:hypothetical protein